MKKFSMTVAAMVTAGVITALIVRSITDKNNAEAGA